MCAINDHLNFYTLSPLICEAGGRLLRLILWHTYNIYMRLFPCGSCFLAHTLSSCCHNSFTVWFSLLQSCLFSLFIPPFIPSFFLWPQFWLVSDRLETSFQLIWLLAHPPLMLRSVMISDTTPPSPSGLILPRSLFLSLPSSFFQMCYY